MKYFIDTEFIESGPYKPIQLISIGIAAEDGRTLYMQSSEFCARDANKWVKTNVLARLDPHGRYHPLAVIASAIDGFVGDEKPEFWAYYGDYDWVVFCQIFGAMVALPERFPKYCRDLKQLCDDLGNPHLPPKESTRHDALDDALWNKRAFEFLDERRKTGWRSGPEIHPSLKGENQ